ncbi:glycosyltransferase family 2 protein [Methylomonas koyamae]|uniref:glycosyltransferase family 2 protein n=1 Tax=Methylomonas koyamae TaxID=702114 RepID=UPI000BC2CDC6|nr:glycosyltransferase [Methylomonas koyamae]ATG88842.1 glycosyl transferase [Methylomonas koyamae]
MKSDQYAITFACYNQINYTRQCIDSMVKHGVDLKRVVVVDNGSRDGTCDYLASLGLGGLILNKSNLGCGVAWNQGALALQAEWTVVMNNDVLASANWLENLIETAEQNQLKIISPALVEGKLDYDFDEFAGNASLKMAKALRLGGKHAVCLAIHDSVWHEIGYFQPVPKLLGYEDTLFFHEAEKAGIACAMTGASWLHHYGSVTQTAMKQERGLSDKQGLGNRYNYRLLQQSWLERKLRKMARLRQANQWHDSELAQYGMTLHGIRQNGDFNWQ